MKLLVIVPYAPNLIRVRPYQITRALHRQQHEITLATLWSTPEEQADLAALEALGITVVAEHLTKLRSLWNTAKTIPSRRPLQAGFCWHPALAQRVETLVTEGAFDAVHVEHLRGALYGLHVRTVVRKLSSNEGEQRVHLPVVWDSVDCISHLFGQAASQSRSLKGRLMTKLDLKRTQLFEGYLVNQFEHVVTTSTTDAMALAQLAVFHSPAGQNPADLVLADGDITGIGSAKISAIPNGVDLDYFQPSDASSAACESDAKPKNPTVVFSGKMSYHANVTAALYLVDEIMPAVWETYPDARVQIVGKDPAPEVQALVEKGRDSAANIARVEVTGTVPDLRPYLTQATVAVAPVPYGAGIQNKVLEAMACGAPIVASAQAASGVVAEPGTDLLVADSAEGFSQAIITLLADVNLRKTLSTAGRRYVEEHHSWDRVAQDLTQIYQK